MAALHEAGLLTAVLPMKCGGAGLTGLSLSEVLRSIGSGSLPLGRLFEGHVNALELVLRYGNHEGSSWLRRKLGQARCSACGTLTTRTGCGSSTGMGAPGSKAERSWLRAQAISNARSSPRAMKTGVD